YVPPRTTIVPPACVAATACAIVRNGASRVPALRSDPEVDTKCAPDGIENALSGTVGAASVSGVDVAALRAGPTVPTASKGVVAVVGRGVGRCWASRVRGRAGTARKRFDTICWLLVFGDSARSPAADRAWNIEKEPARTERPTRKEMRRRLQRNGSV